MTTLQRTTRAAPTLPLPLQTRTVTRKAPSKGPSLNDLPAFADADLAENNALMDRVLDTRRRDGFYHVDPELARLLVERMHYRGERRITGQRLAAVRYLYESGEWNPKRSELYFALQGERFYLMNGYHRLWCAFLLGLTVPFRIEEEEVADADGLVRIYNSFDSPDSARAEADLPAAVQAALPRQFQTALLAATPLLNVGLRVPMRGASFETASQSTSRAARIATLEEWMPHARQIAALCAGRNGLVTRRLRTQGYFAATLVLFKYQAAKAEEFLLGVVDGIGLDKNDPRWRLREFLQMHPARSPGYAMRVLAKAWNTWIAGQEVRLLRPNDTLSLHGTPIKDVES